MQILVSFKWWIFDKIFQLSNDMINFLIKQVSWSISLCLFLPYLLRYITAQLFEISHYAFYGYIVWHTFVFYHTLSKMSMF